LSVTRHSHWARRQQAPPYIDARYATVNNATGDRLNIINATVNREFFILLPVSLVSDLRCELSTAKTSLDTLPYAEGASWNPNLVCLRERRQSLIEDIIKWIYLAEEPTGAGIFWLSDMAGARKRPLHTPLAVLRQSRSTRLVIFLRSQHPEQTHPQKLFTTIARDLVRLGNNLADHIHMVLDGDRSVASACQTRQFEKLILEPSLLYFIGRRVVIVISRLDEGYDLEKRSESSAIVSLNFCETFVFS
jgi:hypothetical protein